MGRDAELKELTELLEQPDCRLVSVLGPGGIGKTRLALQLAETYGAALLDGVCWVSLAGVTGREDLIEALGRAIEVSPDGGEDRLQHLIVGLQKKQILLVLDNFEELLDEAELLAQLLTHAPHLKLLVTSRERLQLQWEWLFDVEGLPYPETRRGRYGQAMEQCSCLLLVASGSTANEH